LAGLMVLMFLTVAVTWFPQLNFGDPWNVMVALTIAIAKMLLIMMFFMHLKFSSKLTVIFAVSGFAWFVMLIVLTWADYFSRVWLSPFVDGKLGS